MSRLSEAVATTVQLSDEATPAGSTVIVLTIVAEDPSRPAVLGPRGLENLDRALDECATQINDGTVSAIVIRGTGRTFCAGADLDMMASITDRTLALTLAESGHRVLGRLRRMGVATVAEINGVALGGGLELALHCTHRVAASSVNAIGLPEVSLGLIPGWGGATLLPRLIGFANAQKVLVDNPVKNNTLLNARSALELGIVDSVVDDDDLHAEVLRTIDRGLDSSRVEYLTTEADVESIRNHGTRLTARPGNPQLAIERLIEVLRTGDTIGAGFAAEDDALADLIMTDEFRNRVYSFHLTSSRARKPAGVPDAQPRDITHVGVIGAGLMATQFALLFAEKLMVPVTLTDVSADRLDAALRRMDEVLETRVNRGTLTHELRTAIRANLRTTLSTRDFHECDFVMEAVFEDLEVKVAVLRGVEEFVSNTCILATNTSSLSVTAMAGELTAPERLVGFHFFNPVAVMPLIEIVQTAHSDAATVSTAVALAGRLRKSPVITKDSPGFVVNRLLSVFLSEALGEVQRGTTPDVVTQSLSPLRLPMDPFALVDLIGRAVTVHMLESLHQFAPSRVIVPDVLLSVTEQPTETTIAEEFANVSGEAQSSEQDIHDRVVDALALEISLMLSEGVVADVRDIDLCMIVGAGWPIAHGGVSKYLDQCGASDRIIGRRFH